MFSRKRKKLFRRFCGKCGGIYETVCRHGKVCLDCDSNKGSINYDFGKTSCKKEFGGLV